MCDSPVPRAMMAAFPTTNTFFRFRV
jgi:hypothetical protein